MKIFTLLLFMLFAKSAHSQNLYLIGNNSYKATSSIGFKPNGSHGIDFVIMRKNDGSGMIALSGESMQSSIAFRGNSYLFLDDGSRIVLIDRKRYDFKDETATTIYNLTASEVEKLSQTSINTIRATMKCVNCISSTAEGTFTVTNTEGYYQMGLGSSERVDTAALVTELFE